MTQPMIGVQMMMLKAKVEENGVYETMRQLAKQGFRAVEVSQIPMTAENVAALKQASEDFDIKIAALSAAVEPMIPNMPGETLEQDFDKIVADCKTLKCTYLRVGMLPLAAMRSKESVLAFIEKAEQFAKRLATEGIHFYYHNHHLEFQKFDGEYLLHIIRDHTEVLGFELDVHWIHRGGLDPVEVIEAFNGRVGLIHLKDYRIGKMDESHLESFNLATFFPAFFNTIEFAELGQGSLNLRAIIEAGKKSGTEYLLIEQDDVYGRDPFICLEESANHLRALGYSELF